jgi:hypothetical protein
MLGVRLEQIMETDGRERNKSGSTLPGIVEKIIQPQPSSLMERAQIKFEDGSETRIRIVNTLKTSDGKTVGLKMGAPVDITIETQNTDATPLK